MFNVPSTRATCVLLAATALCLLAPGGPVVQAQSATAQPPSQTGAGRVYNPAAVETVTGTVTAVDRTAAAGGMSPGVHLTLKTDAGPVDVRLGPAWYLDNQVLHIEPNDKVTVTGSKVDLQGQNVLVASKVKKGDDTLVLRDDNGIPVWSGWRRGGATTRPAAGMGMGRGMGRGMMGAQAGPPMQAAGQLRATPSLASDDPGALLASRQRLQLTTEQVRKLEAIQAEARARANAVLTPDQQKLLDQQKTD